MRQRIRWAKGHLQAFVETAPQLFSHIFVTHGMANREEKPDAPRWKRLFNNIRLRFMSFDMLTIVYPRQLVSFFKKIVVFAMRTVMIYATGYAFVNSGLLPGAAQWIIKTFRLTWAACGETQAIFMLVAFALIWRLNSWLTNMLFAVYVFVAEKKRIVPIKWYRKLWYIFMFPLFDLIGELAMLIALFSHVEWKPIPHNADVKLDELEQQYTGNNK